MIFIFDGSILAILAIIAVGAICGGGTAIAHFISGNMILILVVSAIIFGISLLMYWYSLKESFESKNIRIVNMSIMIVETVFSLIAFRQLLIYFVACEENCGFLAFAFEVLLIAILGLIPVFGSRLFLAFWPVMLEDVDNEKGRNFLLFFMPIIFLLSMIVIIYVFRYV